MAKIKITETMLKKMIAESLRYHLSGRIDESSKHDYKGDTRNVISKWFKGNGKEVSTDSGIVAKIESDFRDTFMHGYSNIIDPVKRLEPIFAKIALDYGWWSYSPNDDVISGLQKITEYIINQSVQHKEKNSGKPFLLNGNYPLNKITSETTYEELKELCSGAFDSDGVSNNSELKIEDIDYSNSKGYEVKKNVSYGEAYEIGKKSGDNSEGRLCYTDNESYWNRYTNNGKNTVYVLLKDGYEKMRAKDYVDHEDRPYDPYGLSMIFLFVDPNGNLKYSNVRWNHKFQELGGNRTDDNFTKEEIEKLTGLSFDNHFINVGDNSISYLKKIEDCIAGKDMNGELVSWDEMPLNVQKNYYMVMTKSGHVNVVDRNTNKLLFSKWFDKITEKTVIGSKVFWQVRFGERRNILSSGGFLLFDGPTREWPEFISGFTNGILIFRINDKVNLMDYNGNILYEPNNPDKWFDYIKANYDNEFWFVRKNDKFYIFTINGQLMSFNDAFKNFIAQGYNVKKFFTTCYDNGDYYSLQIYNKYNVMRKDGTLISDTWFDYVGDFSEGLAVVELENKYSLMDFNGKIIYEPNNPEKWFDNCSNVCEGHSVVILNRQENFIDTNGNILSPNQWFDQCLNFHKNGFASVGLNGTWYSIDKDGNLYTAFSRKPVSISNGEISIKESKNTDIKRLKNLIYEEISNYLLTEATEQSLHQQYDKMFGKENIDYIIQRDSTPNKKFAEWIIKICIKQNRQEPLKAYAKYLFNDADPFEELVYAVKNGFQPYSFNDIETALENFRRKQINHAVYKDDTIHIYNPKSYFELKALIKAVAKQPLDRFHWCVSSSDAKSFWPRYTNNDEYQIFFIHNIKQNQFYLWNNNPSEDTRIQFNNQDNEPVKPISTAGLTDGAVQFLDSTIELDFVEDIDKKITGENGYIAYEGVLGGRYNLYDPDPDNVYHHIFYLCSVDDANVQYDFGYTSYDVLLDSPRLLIMRGEASYDYSVAYIDEDGDINFDDETCDYWGKEENGIYIVTSIPKKLVVYNQNNGNIFSVNINEPMYLGMVGNYLVVKNDDYDIYYVIDENNGEIVFKSSDIVDYGIYGNRVELYVDEDFDIGDYENIKTVESEDVDDPYIRVDRNGTLYYYCSRY